ncbi:hypothetical protein [uncultured Lacinutrix sp.]|uniref:hypothetical protein n=1 Tax=uncultured Lacinutrix sp. TaxID=574032 RepID=UPI002601D17C|nr:hypothetical protein [uncultured Lacinutrix sp.]
MNLVNSSIFTIFKHITFVVMLFAMVGQSSIQVFAIISDLDYNCVNVNNEQDSDEEEQQENTKEEKVEIVIIDFNQYFESNVGVKLNDAFYLSIYSDFNMKINIPPPDFR